MFEQAYERSDGGHQRSEIPTAFKAYERFKIDTNPAPSRIRQVHPFIPQINQIRLALMLIREILRNAGNLKEKKYRKVVLSRPCIYGVFSGRLGGFHPQRELCTGCMRCVQEYPSICRVEKNPEFMKFKDSYWTSKNHSTSSFSPVATVNFEAETGEIPIKGMGFKGEFAKPGWDSMWTDMSEIVRPTRDGVYGREYISTLVDIGRKPSYVEFSGARPIVRSRTVQLPIPIIFDYLPPPMSSECIKHSISMASHRIGTFYIERLHETRNVGVAENSRMIPLITSAELEKESSLISKANLIECVLDGSSAYKKIRSLNSRAPLISRVPFKKGIKEIAIEQAQEGVDALHLHANYHGQGIGGSDSEFVKDMIRSVHKALVEAGVRDEITLIASGGIILAEHVPKAIICGADLVAIDTTILVALQSRFEDECLSAEMGRIKKESFSADWGSQRLTNLLGAWHDQLIEILSAMGMRDVRRLRGDVGRAMFKEDLEKDVFDQIAHRT
ncbi:MAG: glutamate synthase-related protein [Candidatus Heimdallarchaeota archaeon]